MKSIIVIAVGLIVMAAGAIWLIRKERFGFREFALLLFLGSPLWFLGRWNVNSAFFFLGRPYLGFENLLLVFAVVFFLLGLAQGYRSVLQFGTLGTLFAVMVFLAFLSGLTNQPSLSGLGAVLQAEYRWVVPLLAAWAAVRCVPNTIEGHRRLQFVFILTHGILTGLIIIASALFTDALQGVFGWEEHIARSAGFARGWSPMGTGISSGIFVVAASVMCLQNVLQNRRIALHSCIMVLCMLAVMLTLSRSVFLAWILSHAFVLRGQISRHFKKILLFAAVLLVVGAVPVYKLVSQYDFSRLTRFSSEMSLRESSLYAGVAAGVDRPALGHGPGILYNWVRFPSTMLPENMQEIVIEGRLSAREPHNAYILVFAERGLAGLMVFIAIIICLAKRLWACLRTTKRYWPVENIRAQAYLAIAATVGLFSATWSSFLLYPKIAMCSWFLMFMMLHHERTVAISLDWAFLRQQEEPRLWAAQTSGLVAGVGASGRQSVR